MMGQVFKGDDEFGWSISSMFGPGFIRSKQLSFY